MQGESLDTGKQIFVQDLVSFTVEYEELGTSYLGIYTVYFDSNIECLVARCFIYKPSTRETSGSTLIVRFIAKPGLEISNVKEDIDLAKGKIAGEEGDLSRFTKAGGHYYIDTLACRIYPISELSSEERVSIRLDRDWRNHHPDKDPDQHLPKSLLPGYGGGLLTDTKSLVPNPSIAVWQDGTGSFYKNFF